MAKSSLYNKIKEIQDVKNTKITTTNIKSGINIFGINGNFTSNANMTSYDLASNKTGYVNGQKITGSLREYTNTSMSIPIDVTVNNISQNITGSYNNIYKIQEDDRTTLVGDGVIRNKSTFNITYNQISSLLNIQAIDIKKDKQILDIIGQYDASTEFQGIKMDPIKASDNSRSLVQSITEISGLDMTEGTNLSSFLRDLYNVTSITNLSAPNVTNLSRFVTSDNHLISFQNVNFYNDSRINGVNADSMFQLCSNLKIIDNSVKLPYNISQAGSMFSQCNNLISVTTPINSYNTPSMFYECLNLKTVPFINTSNFTCMFYNCQNLIDVSNITFYNTYGNYNCYMLFSGCSNLNLDTVNIKKNIINANRMFESCKSITSDKLTNFLYNLNYFSIELSTFAGTGINSIINKSNFGSIIKSNGHYANSLYANCKNITMINLDEIADLNLILHSYTFSNCTNLKEVTIGDKLLNNNCESVFENCTNLINLSIGFNNSRGLSKLASNCTNLSHLNISSNSNFPSTIGMSYILENCTNLKTIDNFEILFSQPIQYSTNAFANCYNLTYNKPLNINITYQAGNMFSNCYKVTSNVNINFTGGYNYWAPALTRAFENSGISSININYTVTENTIGAYNIVSNCSNLTYLSFNATASNNSASCELSENIISGIPNLKTVDIQFSGYINGYRFGMTNTIYNCPNLTSININCNQTNNSKPFQLYLASIYNCPNLTSINLNIKSDQVMNSYFKIANCPNLTNNCIDNIFGVLYDHKNTFKRNTLSNIVNLFPNCNFTNERLSNIPNWSKMQEMNYYI